MTEYEMSQADLDELLESMRPAPAIMLQCGQPSSVQERANAAWMRLGEKMGFDGMTVLPSPKGDRFFFAEPKEAARREAEGQIPPHGIEALELLGWRKPDAPPPPARRENGAPAVTQEMADAARIMQDAPPPTAPFVTDHKWLDPECHASGCRTLILNAELEKLREQRDKFMWQVRDTCARAEAAEADAKFNLERRTVEREQARETIKRLREAVIRAEKMFRWYGDLHAAKEQTPDNAAKTARNYDEADAMKAALAKGGDNG